MSAPVDQTAPVFRGFVRLNANFTPTPNQFFEHIVGRQPYCVVIVVARLIRETVGWENKATGGRREEAALGLMDFICPELCEASARKGIKLAEQAGFIIRTASATAKEKARYALRWDDGEAQREAIQRERRANEDPLAGDDNPNRGLKNRPLNTRGLKSTPPIDINKPSPEKENPDISNGQINPLTVSPSGTGSPGVPDNRFATANGGGRDVYKRLILAAVRKVVALTDDGITDDSKSSGWFIKLHKVCLEYDVLDAWDEAYFATVKAKERTQLQGESFNAGKYFGRTCVNELKRRGISVPTKAELQAEDPNGIEAEIREALGMPPLPENEKRSR